MQSLQEAQGRELDKMTSLGARGSNCCRRTALQYVAVACISSVPTYALKSQSLSWCPSDLVGNEDVDPNDRSSGHRTP